MRTVIGVGCGHDLTDESTGVSQSNRGIKYWHETLGTPTRGPSRFPFSQQIVAVSSSHTAVLLVVALFGSFRESLSPLPSGTLDPPLRRLRLREPDCERRTIAGDLRALDCDASRERDSAVEGVPAATTFSPGRRPVSGRPRFPRHRSDSKLRPAHRDVHVLPGHALVVPAVARAVLGVGRKLRRNLDAVAVVVDLDGAVALGCGLPNEEWPIRRRSRRTFSRTTASSLVGLWRSNRPVELAAVSSRSRLAHPRLSIKLVLIPHVF